MTAETTTSTPVASTLLKSPAKSETGRGSTPEVRAIVEGVIADIRERGDAAVREYSQKFDNYGPESFLLTDEQLAEVMARVPQQVIEDITFGQGRSDSTSVPDTT